MDHFSPSPNRFEADRPSLVGQPLKKDHTVCQPTRMAMEMQANLNRTVARIQPLEAFNPNLGLTDKDFRDHEASTAKFHFDKWEKEHENVPFTHVEPTLFQKVRLAFNRLIARFTT